MRPRQATSVPVARTVAFDAEGTTLGAPMTVVEYIDGTVIRDQAAEPRYARALADELNALVAAGRMRISHHIHLRAEICSETLLDELAEFGAEDRVRLVSQRGVTAELIHLTGDLVRRAAQVFDVGVAHNPALIEDHHAFQQAMVFGRVRQHFVRHQADGRRVNFRRWVERTRSYVEQVFYATVILNHD